MDYFQVFHFREVISFNSRIIVVYNVYNVGDFDVMIGIDDIKLKGSFEVPKYFLVFAEVIPVSFNVFVFNYIFV